MDCVKRMTEIAKEHGITNDAEFARVTGIPQLKAVDFYTGKDRSVYTDTIELFCKAFNITISDFYQESNLFNNEKYQLAKQLYELISYKKETLANFSHGELTFVISDNNVVNFKHTECLKIQKGKLMTK